MKILSCEDHELFREGLRSALAELAADCELVEARTGAEGLARLEADPDIGLALLDLGLPDVAGLELLREMRSRFPLVGVAVVSASERPADARAALAAGAAGFIPKSADRGVLLAALRLILDGGIYLPPLLLAGDEEPAGTGLTPRQREVAALMTRGLTNKEIAGVLGIGAGTVKAHVAAILEVLEVANRTEAVLALVERGWVEGP